MIPMPDVTYHLSITHQGPPGGMTTLLSTPDPIEATRRFVREACSPTSTAQFVHLTVSIDGQGPFTAHCDIAQAPLVSAVFRNERPSIHVVQPPRHTIEHAALIDPTGLRYLQMLLPTSYDARPITQPECGHNPGTPDLRPIPRVEESIPASPRGGTPDPNTPDPKGGVRGVIPGKRNPQC